MVGRVLRGGTEGEGEEGLEWKVESGSGEGGGGGVTRDIKWKAELQQSLPDRNQF